MEVGGANAEKGSTKGLLRIPVHRSVRMKSALRQRC